MSIEISRTLMNRGDAADDSRSGGVRYFLARSLLTGLCCAMSAYAPLSDAGERDAAGAAQSGYSLRLLAAINAYRVEHGVRELNRSVDLDRLAYGHSKDMARAGQLSHEGFRERGARSGGAACVENVGWNYATPEAQLRGWIGSPAHDRNLLDPRVTRAGVGDADAYVTFLACG